MRILIVSATENEVNPLIRKFSFLEKKSPVLYQYLFKDQKIDFLITGIGIFATIYHLSKTVFQEKYDLIINVGIAGSFSKNFPIGSVVNVFKDEFSDFGIDDRGKFKTLFDEFILHSNMFPFENGKLFNENVKHFSDIIKYKIVNSITVNTIHGEENSIKFVKRKFFPHIETMEGAAFFYVCKMEKLKYLQIRSISNFVEPRNRKNWKISLAINNLNKELLSIIKLCKEISW